MTKKHKKLTKVPDLSRSPRKLTGRNEIPFTLCFKISLANGYGFKDLKQNHLKDLHSFLDKVAGLSISDVDKLYLHQPDCEDIIYIKNEEFQIQHYEVTKKFRIHGYYEGELFIVYRLDPNHQVHGG